MGIDAARAVRAVPRFTLAALALALTVAATAQATFPGTPGKIAFEAGVPADIFVMNADGSQLVNVTETPDLDESRPNWSPDGQRLLFTRERETAWVTDADGSLETPLPIVGAGHASWSPDGQKVVFVRFGGGGCFTIHTADLTGTSEALVVPANAGPCFKSRPSWSPAGDFIAFEGYDCNPSCIPTPYVHTVRTDGSNLSGRLAGGIAPTWSPAGHRVLYTAWLPGPNPFQTRSELYTMNPDGSGNLRLNPFTGVEGTLASWSPDGTRVAYTGDNGIWIVDDAGGNPQQITEFAHYSPDWQAQPLLPPEEPGYPRPRGASPFSASLVPAYRECTSPNRTHGAPLSYGSCAPASQASDGLTFGTPDANDRPAAAVGRVTFKTVAGDELTPADEADVQVTAALTDVRCRIGLTGYCTEGALSDYLGGLELAPTLRITDRRSGGLARDPATGFDVVSFAVPIPCAATASAAGSTCATQTSLDALAPGTVVEGKRSVWELGQVLVRDAGIDDPQVEAFSTLAVQGLFAP